MRAYRPQPYGGDVLLFCGTEGFAQQFSEPDLGWGELVRGELAAITVPGTHHTITAGTGARAIAERLLGR